MVLQHVIFTHYLPIIIAAVPTYNCYTEGQLSFGITDIRCNGSENHLVNCSHSQAVFTHLSVHDDAGIVYQGIVMDVIFNCLALYYLLSTPIVLIVKSDLLVVMVLMKVELKILILPSKH